MKLQYFGTAAAEGWPALFCSCDYCKQAAALGGKNIRSRSQAMVDDTLLIELPADTYHHFLTHKFPLPQVQHLLITHSHTDHFYPMELEMRAPGFCDETTPMLTVYGNDSVEKLYQTVEQYEPRVAENNRFQRVELFTPYAVGDYTVTPLRALHDRREECLVYLIEKEGQTLLYGHDTGFFPQDTWDYLADKKLDLVSLDCTTGAYRDGGNHMGLEDTVEVKERLLAEGIAHQDTVFVVSHFSHNGHLLHHELEEKASPHGMLVAYDGMVVTI